MSSDGLYRLHNEWDTGRAVTAKNNYAKRQRRVGENSLVNIKGYQIFTVFGSVITCFLKTAFDWPPSIESSLLKIVNKLHPMALPKINVNNRKGDL